MTIPNPKTDTSPNSLYHQKCLVNPRLEDEIRNETLVIRYLLMIFTIRSGNTPLTLFA